MREPRLCIYKFVALFMQFLTLEVFNLLVSAKCCVSPKSIFTTVNSGFNITVNPPPFFYPCQNWRIKSRIMDELMEWLYLLCIYYLAFYFFFKLVQIQKRGFRFLFSIIFSFVFIYFNEKNFIKIKNVNNVNWKQNKMWRKLMKGYSDIAFIFLIQITLLLTN